jgi:hypothetical protein
MGYFGDEIERALEHWIDINTSTISKKNNTENQNQNFAVKTSKSNTTKAPTKQEKLKTVLRDNDVIEGSSIERKKLIKIITSAGYGQGYAAKEIAPKIVESYNLDVLEDGMVRVYLRNLDRYEWIAKEDRQLINKSKTAHFEQQHFNYP